MLGEAANTLNEFIDTFGFGCEFSMDDIFAIYGQSEAEKRLNLLISYDLVEKNPLLEKYYLTDIFTCTTFLDENLKKDPVKKNRTLCVNVEGLISKDELLDFLNSLKEFEENIKTAEIKDENGKYSINIILKILESESEDIETVAGRFGLKFKKI